MYGGFDHLTSKIHNDLFTGGVRKKTVSNVYIERERKATSPGSVPSTRPGVGLSALSERRRSTGARVSFSHATDALWASPSITASYGTDTHLAGRRPQWDKV